METRNDATLAQEIKANLFQLHGGNIRRYRQRIHHMDEGFGRVMQPLRQAGVERDALVGGKMDLTEGGIRVPWIAHWPALIAPGGSTEQHCRPMTWRMKHRDQRALRLGDSAADMPLR